MSSDNFGHSADVRILISVNGSVLPVAQLGPDFLTLREPSEHPSSDAEILMSIDGKERRWNVHLPEGISAARPRTKIE
jgi:hypothetical protein